MKKEEIISEAYRLCDQIASFGFYPMIRVTFEWHGLHISIFDRKEDGSLNTNVFDADCFLDGDYKNVTEIKPIEKLNEFINHHKKQVA